jgi:hypothetical protein
MQRREAYYGYVDQYRKETDDLRAMLRRAIRLSIEDERRDRVRRQASDARFKEIMAQVAAAQSLAKEEIARLEKLAEK